MLFPRNWNLPMHHAAQRPKTRLAGTEMQVARRVILRALIAAQTDALGYNILFGSSPEKLYHSAMVFAAGTHRIGALIKGRKYYVRVDAFNENGITEGTAVPLD